jgi:hypothetical protein
MRIIFTIPTLPLDKLTFGMSIYGGGGKCILGSHTWETLPPCRFNSCRRRFSDGTPLYRKPSRRPPPVQTLDRLPVGPGGQTGGDQTRWRVAYPRAGPHGVHRGGSSQPSTPTLYPAPSRLIPVGQVPSRPRIPHVSSIGDVASPRAYVRLVAS